MEFNKKSGRVFFLSARGLNIDVEFIPGRQLLANSIFPANEQAGPPSSEVGLHAFTLKSRPSCLTVISLHLPPPLWILPCSAVLK